MYVVALVFLHEKGFLPMKRYIAYHRLDWLLTVPAVTNPKGHALDEIEAAFKRFGFVAPPTLDERTERLVAGHGRLEALDARRRSGNEPPEGVEIDDDGVWLVPVYRGWSSENDDEALAYLLADNRLNEIGGWTRETLAAALVDVAATPESLTGIGFTQFQLDELIGPLVDPIVPEMSFSDDEACNVTFRVTAPAKERLMALLRGIQSDEDRVATICDALEGQ